LTTSVIERHSKNGARRSPHLGFWSVRRIAVFACVASTWLLGSACTLTPLPAARITPCEVFTAHDLWRCIGEPDQRNTETGFTSTMRIASDQLRRRLEHQRPQQACDRTPPRGFVLIDIPGQQGQAPLNAFFHEGDRGKPIVFVVHGLFDDKGTRYIRLVAEFLSLGNGGRSLGVLVPDMRWHGCLLSREWPATLGIAEARDLIAWAKALRVQNPGRPIGLIGFSLGGLDAILAMTEPGAEELFSAGVVAVSPPASLTSLVRELDKPIYRARGPGAAILRFSFRYLLANRLRNQGLSSGQPLFRQYLKFVAARLSEERTPVDVDGLLLAADPSRRLALVRHPLLIIASPTDPVTGDESLHALESAAARLPLVRIVSTPNGGHLGQIARYPQWMADTFDRFFRSAASVSLP
jgi:predicted alpha/beta-fold hydrolase